MRASCCGEGKSTSEIRLTLSRVLISPSTIREPIKKVITLEFFKNKSVEQCRENMKEIQFQFANIERFLSLNCVMGRKRWIKAVNLQER